MSKREEGDPETPTQYAPAGYGFVTAANGESVLVPKVVDPDYDIDVPDNLEELNRHLKPAELQTLRIRMAALRKATGLDTRSYAKIGAELGVSATAVFKEFVEICKAANIDGFYRTALHRKRLSESAKVRHAKRKAAQQDKLCAANQTTTCDAQ